MHRNATVSFGLRLAIAALALLGGGTSDAKEEFQLRDVSPVKLRLEAGGPSMKLSFAGEELDQLTQALLVPRGGKANPEATARLGWVERKQRSVVLSATPKAIRGAYDLRVGDGKRWIGVPVSLEVVDLRSEIERHMGLLRPPEREVTETGVLAKHEWKHYGPYPVAEGGTLSAALTGTADADLYLRWGTPPTLTAYDCRPYKVGTEETCLATGGGHVFVAVHGYAPSSTYQLKVTWMPGPVPGPAPSSGFTHLDVSGQVAAEEMKIFQLPVPAGKTLVIRTFAVSDVDLYIRMDQGPTTYVWLMRAYTSSGDETLTYTTTRAGSLRIGVHGYSSAAFTLKTSDP